MTSKHDVERAPVGRPLTFALTFARSSRLCRRLHLRGPVADGDGARLQFLGHIAHEVDVQQAILQRGALDLDAIGELEAPLKGAGADAAMQELALLVLR